MKFLILVLILGAFLRFYNLTENPAGFFADEAVNGFNAYNILLTGKDEYGITLPFYLQSLGDYRMPIATYSTMPFVIFFGLNEFAIRAVMATYGTLSILLIYLFVKLLKNDEFVALLSAFFLSISPWHIQFSRNGLDYVHMIFYLLLGLYFLFRFIKDQKPRFLIFSTLAFILDFYTAYVIQLVLIPFLIGIIYIYKDIFLSKVNRKTVKTSLVIFLIGLLPFMIFAFFGQSLSRMQSVFPLLHGRPLQETIMSMINTYFQHFSLDFLFLKGDIDMPGHFIRRHSVKGLGELYLFQLPLILLGLFDLYKKYKKLFLFFLLWLLLYPAGSTVVGDGPFAHRSLFGVVPFQIISAFGIVKLFDLVKKYKKTKYACLVLLIMIITFSVFDFSNKLFKEYPTYASGYSGWQYGAREILTYYLEVKDKYQNLYMTDEFNQGRIFLKFYDPLNFCLGKCKLVQFDKPGFKPKPGEIYALSPEMLKKINLESSFSALKVVNYPQGQPAFIIGEVKNVQQ